MDNRDDLREELVAQRAHKEKMDSIKYSSWLAEAEPTSEELVVAVELCLLNNLPVSPLNVRQYIPVIRGYKLADKNERANRFAKGIEELKRLCILGERPELAELLPETGKTAGSLLHIAGKI